MTPFPLFNRARPASLCQLAGVWKPRDLGHGAMAEQKIDGWRCLFFPGLDGKPGLWTRGGIPLQGVAHILARLTEVEQAMGGRFMIDGEFQVGESLSATKAHQERGWRDGDAGLFYAFDAVPMADWERGRCDIPLYQRKGLLKRAIEATAPSPDDWEWRPRSRGKDHGTDPLSLLPDEWVTDADDAQAMAERIWAAGGEGIMIKDAESPYVRARSNCWLKLKKAGVA